jgi:hypothetical protein
VVVEDDSAHLAQRFPDGRDLGQHICTVAIVPHHPHQAANLPLYQMEPVLNIMAGIFWDVGMSSRRTSGRHRVSPPLTPTLYGYHFGLNMGAVI